MQIKHYPLLLILPALTTLAAPNPTGHFSQQQKATSQTVSMPVPIGQNPTPTPLPPSTMGRPPSPSPVKPTRQQPPQELKLQFRSHDGTEISSIPAPSCEQTTPTSPKSTDVQALSKHYQSKQLSSLPPVELAEGARACVPLESVPGSNAKIELCGQDVFVPYSDIGKMIDILLVACTRGEDGAAMNGSVSGGADATKTAWTAGTVNAMVEGRVLFSVRVVRK